MSKEWLNRRGPMLWGFLASLYTALIILAIFLIHPVAEKDRPLTLCNRHVIAYMFFTLAPPIWFVVESTYIYGPGHGKDEDFKHSQELVSRVWATCSILLGFYWFGKP